MNTVINMYKRIVGGNYVSTIEKYPFMATIWYLDGEEFKFKCGCSFIGKRYFLTAAHCLKNREIRRMLVRMGNTNLKNLPLTFRVVKAHIHPKFNLNNLQNDIAVLEVDKDIPEEMYNPLRIPCHHMDNICYNVGHQVKVLGFGKDKDNSTIEHLLDLKEVDLKVKSIEESKYHKSLIGPDMFLAGDIVNGKVVDACTGDSGGPCIKFLKGYWVLIGVVSWGTGCGKQALPGVYTKVLSYHEWIRTVCKFPKCTNH